MVARGNGSRGGRGGTVRITKAGAGFEIVVRHGCKANPYSPPAQAKLLKVVLFNGSLPMVVLEAPGTSPPKENPG